MTITIVLNYDFEGALKNNPLTSHNLFEMTKCDIVIFNASC